jgi:para-nitrobenzyl esterase
MAMPAAKGLFHKAVVQSGSMITARTKETATASAKAFMDVLGLKSDQVAELRALPMTKIVDGLSALRQRPEANVGFGPVLDGRSLPRHPFEPNAPEVSADVPLLVGTIKDEMTLLRGAADPKLFELTWDELPKRLSASTKGLNQAKFIADLRKLHPDATASDVFFMVTTEQSFRNPAIKQAELKSAAGAAPAYMYQLVWETPVEGGKWKAPHALEIGMVFDNVQKSESMSGISPEAQKIADQMSDAWLAFARSGNPGWPAYDTKTRATMMFDVESKVVNDPNHDDRLLFAKLPPGGL